MSDAPRRVSTLGVLGECLVDSDRERLSLSRRNRAKSMLLSVLVQTGLLTAVIVIPLFATGKLPLSSFSPPTVIFRGTLHSDAPAAKQPGGPVHTSKPPRLDPNKQIFQPPRIPPRIADVNDKNPTQGEGATDPAGPLGDPRGVMDPPPGWVQNFSRNVVPVAPPEPGKTRIKQGGDVQAALLIHRVDPVYPPLAVQARIQGVVQLHAIIARDGSVRALEAVSGHPLLAKAALDVVPMWRYRPTLLNGEPVEVDTHITVHFILNR